jgi:hypothetical protein
MLDSSIIINVLMMAAVKASETSVSTYQTVRRNIPEDGLVIMRT